MANRHFGNIGDIWKHLPLAEILRIEQPTRYWESHSGSASYPLTSSVGRDYGVMRYRDHSPNKSVLKDSAYNSVLDRLAVSGELTEYPGSPLIAMHVLDDASTQYLFADIDGGSCETISIAGRELQIDDERLVVASRDGLSVIEQAADELADTDKPNTFVQLDPYEPFLKSANDVDSIDLFARLTARGMQCLLWYGFDSHENRDTLIDSVHRAFSSRASNGPIWCGEIVLAAFDDSTIDYVPGVLACGILCSNISEQAETACTKLGNGLVEIYRNAKLPCGRSGAINFRADRIRI